ncbi:hypothetical protein N7448_001647 [Penicillium atrosanguineum]|uniref:NTP binding protein n=1 Tax=Penicillium atrosanguineum TaxID=1132637 RepID=A0A9W9HJL1_9EURO|nr:hypothetical protein N7448_001647 [Penicillium atrosanguineum]KAJ5324846.1 hypothetical protein N7476_003446 [Penicillium atrosanguineum]
MEIDSRVELPDGHLVNLSPRPQHKPQYRAYRANYTATTLSSPTPPQNTHQVYCSELAECSSPLDNMYQKGKATKLPVPKSLTERSREQRNQTPSPTGIPKPSSTVLSSGGSGGQSGERDRDRYWSRLTDKIEKDSSPLSQRVSYHRTRESDKKRSPQINLYQESTHSVVREEVREEATSRVPQSRTTIATPTTNVRNYYAQNEPDHSIESEKPWQIQERHWSPVDMHGTTPQKSEITYTATESSPRSRPSISPVSDDSSVTDCDWEDRFVVHMPSAKEPNPPSMTSQQIADYQKSIEKVRREGGHMVHPSTRPSPRKDSPDGKPNRMSAGSGQFKAYDGRPMLSPPQFERQSVSVPAPAPASPSAPASHSLEPPGQKNYYSPDEIGKNRISTIWEEQSPTKPKEKRSSATPDGSFLGCKEINGPGTKNPDEILLFASGENSKTLQPRPPALSVKKRQKEEKKKAPRISQESNRTPPKSGESLVQEEWAQHSRNSKQAPCSRSSSATLCQEPICSQSDLPRTDSQGSSKENFYLAPSTSNSSEKLEDTRSDDDVFIITPTITRTMIPTSTPDQKKEKKLKAEKKPYIPKPQGLRRPGGIGQSGTGEAVKAIRAKAQVISTPSGLRPAAAASQGKSIASSLTSSKTTPLSSIPTAKDKGKESITTKEVPVKKPEITLKNLSKAKDKEKDDHAKQTGGSIRGFIRTSGLARSTGLVRSPTDSLATILRHGTESLRNRAESLRKGNGSSISRNGSPVSQPSGPSRDNSESSRSERSFKSAREKATPPPSTKPSPAKNENQSSASKLSSVEKPSPPEKASKTESLPMEKSPPMEKSLPMEKPVDNSPLSAERIARLERLERFKEQARLRRARKSAEVEIAELDGHQVPKRKESLQPNITDVCDDLGELNSQDKDEPFKDAANTQALSMMFEIVFVAVTNMHKGLLQVTDSPYAKFLVTNVLNMVRHCYRVFSLVYHVVSKYQTTGTWPTAKNDQAISRFLMELLQAIIYLFILGFGFMLAGRAASYVVLVGSWIVWFARPFAWAFQCVGRVLVD